MKVLLNTSPLADGNKDRGIGMYTRQLLASLRDFSPQNQSLIVQATHEVIEKIVSPELDFDLIHYPFFDFFFATLPTNHKLPFIVTIHDVIPLLYPKQYPAGIKGTIKLLRQKWAVQKATAIITDSQASKDGITEKLSIPSNKVFVVPLAGNPEISELSDSQARRLESSLSLPKKYIVYVGDINYNKNLPALLLALTQLPSDLHLCVVSRTFHNKSIPEGQRLASIIRENDLEDRVHVLDIPHDSPKLLSAVMHESVAVIQPSLWEGFGLPVLEAFQAGALVVSSNAGSLPEVYGEAAIAIEPTIIGLVTGVENALKLRGEEREKLIQLGRQQAKKFSWEKTAQLTCQVYEEILSREGQA